MKLQIIIKVKNIENFDETLALIEDLRKKYPHTFNAANICIEVGK